MQYQEINLFNTAFISPFTEKRPVSLYVREDIIDTHKIELACSGTVEWKLVEYQDHVYFMAWIPLTSRFTKVKNGKIQQLGVYVFTDTPSMFETAHQCHTHEWLSHYWNKLFLMTTPVLQYVPQSSTHTRDMHIDFFISNTYPLQKALILGHSVHTTWIDMLANRSYTIGNGLTLFLTKVKTGYVQQLVAKQCIQHLFREYGTDLYQAVGDRWMELYYEHPTMHVCDNPYFYCAMGNPCVPYEIFEMFTPHDEDIIMNHAHGNTRVLSTIRSIMLTNFKPDWWEQFTGEAWYVCPFDIDTEDEYAPNLASFYISMVKTKASWNWWMRHHEEYLESVHVLLSKYHSSTRLIETVLQPVLHLYEHAKEYQPILCYSRLRTLWQQLLFKFDPNGEFIIPMIQRWSLRYMFIHSLKVSGYISQPGWEFQPPVAFLKDVVELYSDTCDLYQKYSLRIYSEYDRMIARMFPDLQHDTALRSNFHTIKVLQTAPNHSTFHIFYQTFLKARIESRLLGIYHGFGMFENKKSSMTKWQHVSGLHTVGFLVLEHLRENRIHLYA